MVENIQKKAINPQGYNYGIDPQNVNPFWKQAGNVVGVTASASVLPTAGIPNVDVTETTDPETGDVNIDFQFSGLKGEPGTAGDDGQPGQDGITPVINITASVLPVAGSIQPMVSVEKTGTDEAPNFEFTFENLGGGGGGSDITPEAQKILGSYDGTEINNISVRCNGLISSGSSIIDKLTNIDDLVIDSIYVPNIKNNNGNCTLLFADSSNTFNFEEPYCFISSLIDDGNEVYQYCDFGRGEGAVFLASPTSYRWGLVNVGGQLIGHFNDDFINNEGTEITISDFSPVGMSMLHWNVGCPFISFSTNSINDLTQIFGSEKFIFKPNPNRESYITQALEIRSSLGFTLSRRASQLSDDSMWFIPDPNESPNTHTGELWFNTFYVLTAGYIDNPVYSHSITLSLSNYNGVITIDDVMTAINTERLVKQLYETLQNGYNRSYTMNTRTPSIADYHYMFPDITLYQPGQSWSDPPTVYSQVTQPGTYRIATSIKEEQFPWGTETIVKQWSVMPYNSTAFSLSDSKATFTINITV